MTQGAVTCAAPTPSEPQSPPPSAQWRALTPALAARGRTRLSYGGGRSYPRRLDRPRSQFAATESVRQWRLLRPAPRRVEIARAMPPGSRRAPGQREWLRAVLAEIEARLRSRLIYLD